MNEESVGSKVIQFVKNPIEWQSSESIIDLLGEDFYSSSKNNPNSLAYCTGDGSSYFLGGYLIAHAFEKKLGVRDILLKQPKKYRYLDPLKLCQVLAISANELPGSIIWNNHKEKLIHRVEINNSFEYRIPVEYLSQLSLPIVSRRKFEDMTYNELVRWHRFTQNEDAVKEYYDRINKDIETSIRKNFSYANKSHKDFQSLVDGGIIAATEALNLFDLSKGFKFMTYFHSICKRRMIDQLRSSLGVSRRTMDLASKVSQYEVENPDSKLTIEFACKEFKASKNTMQTAFDIARVGINNYLISLDSTKNPNDEDSEGSIKEKYQSESQQSPLSILIEKESTSELLNSLSDRDRKIIQGYYWENKTMKEISEKLELSESRVSQDHTRIIQEFKSLLEQNKS